MRATRYLAWACLLVLAAPAAADTEQPRVVLKVDVKEEISRTDASGNILVVHQPVERADPGDVLLYTLTYTNLGGRAAVNANVDDPIPSGTVLLPGSASGERARITFSIDGGKTYTTYPAIQAVTGDDGRTVQKEAPAESYTHVRWSATDALAPGESRTASFKVVVR
jgi:uncharacterized repeat protein (TIGR01451 family)